MEEMLMNWFFTPNLQLFNNTAETTSWLRDVASKFSVQDVFDLWEFQRKARMGTKFLSAAPLPELKNALASKMRQKGVAEKYIQTGLASEPVPVVAPMMI